jgi:hypothetical protein
MLLHCSRTIRPTKILVHERVAKKYRYRCGIVYTAAASVSRTASASTSASTSNSSAQSLHQNNSNNNNNNNDARVPQATTTTTTTNVLPNLTIIQYPSNHPVTTVANNDDDSTVSNINLYAKYGTKATIYSNQNEYSLQWSQYIHTPKQLQLDQVEVADEERNKTTSSSSSSFSSSSFSSSSLWHMTRIRQMLYDTILVHFVPVQYPTSVQQPGYTTYATYSFLAAIAGSASMVLSTQLLLSTMFTTTTTTTTTATAATAGALNWVIKDGIGQLGGIIVASQMGHYHAFDNNPKRYRMYSAMLLDLAAFIEICTPLLCIAFGPTMMHYSPTTMIVLPSACIATICKNIGYIMASASRAALHQSLCIRNITNSSVTTTIDPVTLNVQQKDALVKETVQYRTTNTNNNLADVTAKFGSQSTAAGLIGTIIGISFSAITSYGNGIVAFPTVPSLQLIDMQQCYSLIGFMLLVGIHQSCNYIAVRNVALHHFNRHRLNIVLRHYVRMHTRSLSSNLDTSTTHSDMAVLTPTIVAKSEHFLPKLFYPFDSSDAYNEWLSIGCTLPSICPKGWQQFLQLREVCPQEKYIVNIALNDAITENKCIQLVYFDQATSTDIFRGMMHAHFLQDLVVKEHPKKDIVDNGKCMDCTRVLYLISNSHESVQSLFPSFVQQLQDVGWNLQTACVEEDPNSFRLGVHSVLDTRND